MGCWNGTCGLTTLPINHYQPIVVFPLLSDVDYAVRPGRYSSNPMYTPMMLPFYSHYDDYGAGEDSSGIGLRLNMAHIRDTLVEQAEGENKYSTPAILRKDFDEKVFWKAIHADQLSIRGGAATRKRVNMVMVIKSIYDTVVAEHRIDRYTQEAGDFVNNPYGFAEIEAAIPALVAAVIAHVAKHNTSPRHYGRIHTGMINNLAEQWLYPDGRSYHAACDLPLDNIINDMIGSDTATSQLTELFTELTKANFFDNFMKLTRKTWAVQAGAGSQDNDTAPYRILNRAMDVVMTEWEES